MSIFRKNKLKLFGNNIEPACKICEHCEMIETELFCTLKKKCDKPCKKFVYDPLKRKPKSAPKLGNFSADDFSID